MEARVPMRIHQVHTATPCGDGIDVPRPWARVPFERIHDPSGVAGGNCCHGA